MLKEVEKEKTKSQGSFMRMEEISRDDQRSQLARKTGFYGETDTLESVIAAENHPTDKNKKRKRKDAELLTSSFTQIALIGILIDQLKNTLASSHAFFTASHETVLAYEDKLRLCDKQAVSEKTYEILAEESKEVNQYLVEIKAANDAQDIERAEQLEMEMENLANYYEMQMHPKAHVYVHRNERAEELEDHIHCGKCAKMERQMYVFFEKGPNGDIRGVKRNIGDVLNLEPAELIVTGTEAKAAVAEAKAAPALHHQ